MAIRLQRPSPAISDFVDDQAQVVAIDSFRPAGSAEIIRGRFYRLSDPAVKTWPQMFALVIRIDQIADEIIER